MHVHTATIYLMAIILSKDIGREWLYGVPAVRGIKSLLWFTIWLAITLKTANRGKKGNDACVKRGKNLAHV